MPKFVNTGMKHHTSRKVKMKANGKSSGFFYSEYRGMYSSLAAIAFVILVFYILFEVDDPIEIFDGGVQIIQRYSQVCGWVTALWDVLTVKFDNVGIIPWIISELTGKDFHFVDLEYIIDKIFSGFMGVW